MDFRQTVQPNVRSAGVSTPPATPAAHSAEQHHEERFGRDSSLGKWMRVSTFVLLVGITILLAALAFGFGHGRSSSEGGLVDTKKYQAVFLNNGQVYFGNIQSLNGQYVHMTNIYYLTQSSDSSSSSTSGNYSLIKLGCQQIHDPTDSMVINRDEVSFWENLNSDGKVVQSIDKFKQQNPNGPDCSQVSSQTQASSTNAQGTGTTDSTTQK